MLRSAILMLVVGSAMGADFNYNRCDKTYGPTGSSGWTGACKTGSENTPINLCGAVSFTTISGVTAAPTLTGTNWDTARTVSILNNGYTIQVNMPTTTTTTLVDGKLGYYVGRVSDSTTATTWNLAQMHLHYGRTGKTDEGSEHYLQGKAYPAEAHFVHYNSKYSSLTDAVAAGSADALLVVGVFLEVQSSNAEILTGMAAAAGTATKTATALSTQYKLNDLFSGNSVTGTYYAYKGGLTTPTCSEIVSWVVMKDPKGITSDNLAKFKAASTSPSSSAMKWAIQASEVQGKYGTYRPLQGVNSRTVYISSGSSAACSTVTEPTFSCSAALFAQPSFLVALLAFCFFYTQQ